MSSIAAGREARSLMEVFASLPDPRSTHGRRHPLGAILALAVCAMLSGARSLYAIAQWGRDQGSPLTQALGFTRARTPCVSTLHLVFRRVDQEAFERALGAWLQKCGLDAADAVAVDGKTLRGIHGEEIPGVHLVAAYAHRTGVVVGQRATKGKGHELEAASALLEQLPLQGLVVTGDAHFAQRNLSCQVVANGGTSSGWSRTINQR